MQGLDARRWRAFCVNAAILCILGSSGTYALIPGRQPRPDADVLSVQQLESKSAASSDGFRPLSASNTPDAEPGSTTKVALLPSWKWESYHSHDLMLEFLRQLVESSGGTCKLERLGASVQGRDIMAMVVGSEEGNANPLGLPKPVFMWIGNMHGDETANRELLLRLIWGLCTGKLAAADPRWAAVQAETVIHIIPTMNPDGFAAMRRYNVRNVDLNRNFWTSAFPYAKPSRAVALARNEWGRFLHDTAATWSQVGNFSLQPEARAVTSYLTTHLPDLSANLHGGSLVANYPLDACDSLGEEYDCPTAEEPVPRLLAQAYASANPPMFAEDFPPFQNGTVQGATWYPVLGSLQDWVYHALQRLHLTLELHTIKDPPASDLPGLWQDNHPAMLRLMELARMGLRARVVDEVTREPLDAVVTVTRPAGVRGTVASADRDGYFFKPMAPGLQYVMSVQPYDPSDPEKVYQPVVVRARLGMRRDAVAAGSGMADLTVQRLLLAVQSQDKKKRRRLLSSSSSSSSSVSGGSGGLRGSRGA